MAENQTKAQVILEANTATFMTQIRSVATQARSIFNRVFSAIRLPGLLSIGGLVAGSVALPTTGRTIGEAVQMQRLHGQLDRLNATLVAELAPIRMLILRILIVLLGAVNAVARLFSNLMEKFPEIGNFVKGLIALVVLFFSFKYFIRALNFVIAVLVQFRKEIGKGALAVAKFIFKDLLKFPGAFQTLRRHNFSPFKTLSIALSQLFAAWRGKLTNFAQQLTLKLGSYINLRFFGKTIQSFIQAVDKLLHWIGVLGTRTGRLNKFLDYLLTPLLQFAAVLVVLGRIVLVFVSFLMSAVVAGISALGSAIAAFIGGLVGIFGIFGTILLIGAVIVGVISVIYLIIFGFKYIVAVLKSIGSILWNVLSWIAGLFKSIFVLLFNALKWIVKGILWALYNLIIVPIAALGKWFWNVFTSLFNNISDWLKSLFEAPPFTIQGTGSFGGFSKEELELASPKMPELVTIGTTVVNLLDQIKKLIEQQRSAAVRRVSGVI
jgi:hypothetical protein